MGSCGRSQALEVVEDRLGAGLPDRDPPVRRRAPGLLLDGIEPGDAPDGLLGDGRALGAMHVDELAADMGHAGDLADGAGAVEFLEAGVAIGMHPAAEAGEVVLRVLALAVAREAIPGRRGCRAAPRPLVTGIGPEPRGLRLAGAGREHARPGCRRRRSPPPPAHAARSPRPAAPAGRSTCRPSRPTWNDRGRARRARTLFPSGRGPIRISARRAANERLHGRGGTPNGERRHDPGSEFLSLPQKSIP